MAKAGDKIGPYTLISKLGRGAFGVVWLAEKRTAITTTKVAIKIPNDEDIDLEAIRQEASLWVHASGHPNVLPIIDADIYDEQIVIVSEYAPDGSLSKWLEKHGGKAPTTEAAVEMALGILSGLDHLHKRNIIHRDLKPDNILLQNETPRLADFGIARILKTTSKSTIATGTPAYMPPEAFDGKRGEETDIWSAGVIFYQLLSGTLPFPQTDMPSLLAAIITREPEPLPRNIPEPLRKIVEQALQKNPEARFPSAAEMSKRIREAANTKSTRGSDEETIRAAPEALPRPVISSATPTEPLSSTVRSPANSKEPATLPIGRPEPLVQSEEPEPKRSGLRKALVVVFALLFLGLLVGGIVSYQNSNSGRDYSTSYGNENNKNGAKSSLDTSASTKTSSAASTPTPAPATVSVRLTQVENNADVQDRPIRRSNISIQAGGVSLNKLTNSDGVAVFDAVPCGGEILITAYSEADGKDVTFRRNLSCDSSVADLGVIDASYSGQPKLTQRKPKYMVFDGMKWVSGKEYERTNP
ncbi:MAG: protein kinase [Pyrinomonadaceae bacterium]|nr:protein kinase [Pyrinomonadaceae bacterium]